MDIKVIYFIGSLVLGLAIHYFVKGLSLSDADKNQLQDIMMEQLEQIVPENRNQFAELCIRRRRRCQQYMFEGPRAYFHWQPGVEKGGKDRFWRTYRCVYNKRPNQCPIDGGWTEWSLWSSCDSDCQDKGWQVRARRCENPKPSNGGELCEGASHKNKTCIGNCKGDADGEERAKQYIQQIHAVFPELTQSCYEKHCVYDDVAKVIKDESKVDRYWTSISCVKYGGACPVNGGWNEWADWSECSVQCGYGERYRKRQCDSPTTKNGGLFCQGQFYETKQCLDKNCDDDESFSDWAEFSSCSESCGKFGTKTSTRACLNERKCKVGEQKLSEIIKTVPCYGGECPHDGGWGKWLSWTACSAKCGTGRRARMRRCDSPYPSNGEDCPGPRTLVATCEGKFCRQRPEKDDSSKGDNDDNGDDDDEDDGLKRRRRRSVEEFEDKELHTFLPDKTNLPTAVRPDQDSNSTVYIDDLLSSADEPFVNKSNDNTLMDNFIHLDIKTPSMKLKYAHENTVRFHILNEMEKDNETTAQRDDKKWQINSMNAIYLGQKRQLRSVNVRSDDNDEEQTVVDDDDPLSMAFNPDLEPLYTQWTKWSACSVSCGGGVRTRKRSCKDKKTECRGETSPAQFCNMEPCPVAGGWGAWQGWQPCSVTCGTGVSQRFRACDSPLPAFGGACTGINSQSQPCSMPKCPSSRKNTKSWGAWTLWSGCSVTCGGGTQRRHKNRESSTDTKTETLMCNTEVCAEKGMWAAWGSWSACTQTCGLGQTYRDRTCTDPAPVYGGDPCQGSGSERETCYGGPCKDEDDFGILLQENGYLKYHELGRSTGFVMVFMRIKALQLSGTLFHHTKACNGPQLSDCELSILAVLTGGFVELDAKVSSKKDPIKFRSTTAVALNTWQDVLVLVTEGWGEIRVNDEPRVVMKFPKRLDHIINLDGELMVGADRHKKNGFHGEIAALRKNFKILLLFNMKSWSGYGVPAGQSNTKKIPLSTTARHPDFHGIHYSHLFFEQSISLEISAVFQLTGINGMLFFNGGKDTGTFTSGIVQNGALQYCLDCGGKPTCRRAYEMKVGEWYFLKVSVKKKEGEIRMNEGDAMQIMCPVGTEYRPRSSLYVGGAGEKDRSIITELTQNSVLFHGWIDMLTVNGLLVTYKMATLVDINHGINSLGYSLADHVTEVYEQSKSMTTLRCGVSEKIKRDHLVKIIWFQDMKHLISGVGTEIVDTDSEDQFVSKANLHSSEHSEGVYVCVLSKDGDLSVLHAFVLLKNVTPEKAEEESFAEWVLFIVVMLVILFCFCPLIIYYCTKDYPIWDRIKNFCKKETEQAKPVEEEKGEEDPLLTSGETTATEAESESEPEAATSTPEPVTPPPRRSVLKPTQPPQPLSQPLSQPPPTITVDTQTYSEPRRTVMRSTREMFTQDNMMGERQQPPQQSIHERMSRAMSSRSLHQPPEPPVDTQPQPQPQPPPQTRERAIRFAHQTSQGRLQRQPCYLYPPDEGICLPSEALINCSSRLPFQLGANMPPPPGQSGSAMDCITYVDLLRNPYFISQDICQNANNNWNDGMANLNSSQNNQGSANCDPLQDDNYNIFCSNENDLELQKEEKNSQLSFKHKSCSLNKQGSCNYSEDPFDVNHDSSSNEVHGVMTVLSGDKELFDLDESKKQSADQLFFKNVVDMTETSSSLMLEEETTQMKKAGRAKFKTCRKEREKKEFPKKKKKKAEGRPLAIRKSDFSCVVDLEHQKDTDMEPLKTHVLQQQGDMDKRTKSMLKWTLSKNIMYPTDAQYGYLAETKEISPDRNLYKHTVPSNPTQRTVQMRSSTAHNETDIDTKLNGQCCSKDVYMNQQGRVCSQVDSVHESSPGISFSLHDQLSQPQSYDYEYLYPSQQTDTQTEHNADNTANLKITKSGHSIQYRDGKMKIRRLTPIFENDNEEGT